MNSTKKLINALLDGAILEKEHLDKDYPSWCEKEWIFAYIQNDKVCFDIKGFKSDIGVPEDRIIDILKNSENWRISEKRMSDGYPYPWS